MIVVVGGHSRNIGKTAVCCSVIRALPELNWTAIKITQYGHGICSQSGKECRCAPESPECSFELTTETSANASDTGRYLECGAAQAWWLRVSVGGLAEAMEELRKVVADSENVILESNSVVEYLTPDRYLFVADFTVDDFKDSARTLLRRADALIVTNSGQSSPAWREIPPQDMAGKPLLMAPAPLYTSARLVGWLRE